MMGLGPTLRCWCALPGALRLRKPGEHPTSMPRTDPCSGIEWTRVDAVRCSILRSEPVPPMIAILKSDKEYARWLTEDPGGFVLNTRRRRTYPT